MFTANRSIDYGLAYYCETQATDKEVIYYVLATAD